MVDTRQSWAVSLIVLLLSISTNLVLAQTAGSVFQDCPECPEMVVIPAGEFLMGSRSDPANDFIPGPEEQPQHSVTLTSFALGKYEVTQDQWHAVMADNPSGHKGGMLPVEQVSWEDIQVFIQKLNAMTGKLYRLPTEAEWEYAARAGSTTLYSPGDDVALLQLYAWFDGIRSAGAHPVGEKLPNKFGLYDMHGNVWEWVQDCYKKDYVGAPVDGSAAVEKPGCLRINRGGCWYNPPEELRSSRRVWDSSALQDVSLGFRLAMTLP